MTNTSFLSAVELSIGYTINKKKDLLFENLNLHLHPGQLVCFMGPNGIGKSSLIRTLAGLQKALSGNVIINQSPGNENTSRKISVVLTDKVTGVDMSVYEIVAFGRYPFLDWNIRLSTQDKEIIDRSINMISIQHLAHRKLHELSDGQMQMVMIARALAQDTPIILLDEPTAHLDLNNRVEIMKLLRNLVRSTNKAILVATHELDLALQLADWIWLAGRDKKILKGTPEDLILDGSFDNIFEFKGFDLKTGKIHHEANRGVAVQLTGDGYEYLWTKNALERNGFEIVEQRSAIQVRIVRHENERRWNLIKAGVNQNFISLEELINSI